MHLSAKYYLRLSTFSELGLGLFAGAADRKKWEKEGDDGVRFSLYLNQPKTTVAPPPL